MFIHLWGTATHITETYSSEISSQLVCSMGSDNELRRKNPKYLLAFKRLTAVSVLFFLILYVFRLLSGGGSLNSSRDQHGLTPSSVFRRPLHDSVTSRDDDDQSGSSNEGNSRQVGTLQQKQQAQGSESESESGMNDKVSPVMAADEPTALSWSSSASSSSLSCSVDGGKCLGLDTVLLIICANRPEYLQRTLDAVIKHHPKTAVPIVISEDGHSAKVGEVVAKVQSDFKVNGGTVDFIHEHHPFSKAPAQNGYFKLAAHYKWALGYVFEKFKSSVPIKRVIILEEDLEIALDFFEYFGAVKSLVDEDTSLLAASAFNDNGYAGRDNFKLYRSDFFPGLGWMISVRIWDELKGKWPKAYWDDWLREPKQRLDRHIIRPEVCRTFHFGTRGVSNAQYSKYLNAIKLNEEFVKFGSIDLSYLQKENWDHYYIDAIKRTKRIQTNDFDRVSDKEVHVVYSKISEGHEDGAFGVVARWAGAMDNIKAMVPRTAYRGIVSVWKGDKLVHLVPTSVL